MWDLEAYIRRIKGVVNPQAIPTSMNPSVHCAMDGVSPATGASSALIADILVETTLQILRGSETVLDQVLLLWSVLKFDSNSSTSTPYE